MIPTHDSNNASVVTQNKWEQANLDCHPLASDQIGKVFWGTVDRLTNRAADRLNPILVKESRQFLKSMQFTITFFVLLAFSFGWTICGISIYSPNIYYLPLGTEMLTGYYFVLAVPLLLVVPLSAYRSLSAELDDGTFEMLAITQLSAMKIVMGKLNSAILQTFVFFAAVVPCVAFCYLLRGFDLLSLGLVVATIFFITLMLTTIGLVLATLTANRMGQMFTLLALIGICISGEIMCSVFCLDGLLAENNTWDRDTILALAYGALIAGSFMVLFCYAAAAKISPLSENRSTKLRWCMFSQQFLWIGFVVLMDDSDFFVFGILSLAAYWLIMGTLMLSESPDLSPRVQRGLPATFFSRSLLTWFNPGPGTGFMFATCTGMAGIAVLLIFSTRTQRFLSGLPYTSALLGTGYLLMYLGITRLILVAIGPRLRSFPLSISIAALLETFGVMGPYIFFVGLLGHQPIDLDIFHFTNWAWAIDSLLNRSLSQEMAVLIFMVGSFILLINLGLLFREFRFRRIATPDRVLAEDGALHPDKKQENLASPFA